MDAASCAVAQSRRNAAIMALMPDEKKLQFDDLMALATASAAVTRACACAIDSCGEWARIPPSFPAQQMRTVGTLVDDPYVEATHAEYHPAGTHYWSADAPIAWRHYPFNRCSVLACSVCGRCCLTYVEAGGYYVEPRMRALDPRLLVDPPGELK
ncbi:MAG: hypothetical protein WCC39_03155 [Telluria sp.]